MVIANPIYDTVFKKLMENERVAKFFVGTLMDEIIEDIKVMPQEFTYRNSLDIMTIFRLDFIATIKTKEGNFKKILIEIQKGRNVRDLMRFRNYLAEQYKKEELVDSDGIGIEEEMTLPITSIYILGFNLEGIDSACLKVERNYVDLINNKTITQKSDFIEKLTHDSYIVQVKRITDRYQTSLDKLLSVFEQRNFLNDDKIIKEYSHNPDVEEVQLITEILHYSGTSPVERREIEIEIEAWRTFNASQSEAAKKAMRDLEKTRKELEEEREEKEKMREELEKQKLENEAAKQKLEQELEQQKLKAEQQQEQIQEMQKMMEELKRRLDNSDN